MSATTSGVDTRSSVTVDGGPPSHVQPIRARPVGAGDCRISSSFTAIPLLVDSSPDWSHRWVGKELTLVGDLVEMRVDRGEDPKTGAVLLAFQEAPGRHRCAAVDIRHVHRSDEGHWIVEGQWGGYGTAILDPENLVPRFARETLEFRSSLPPEVLSRWAEIGILEPYLMDRHQVCPSCEGLPTFRPGCRRCGSARIESDRLIHHFACAHVGPMLDFRTTDGIECPKCHIRELIVGGDYEYLSGPVRCTDCHWSDVSMEQVGQCLSCGLRFPGHQAHQKELRGYRVQRLDPLALSPSP